MRAGAWRIVACWALSAAATASAVQAAESAFPAKPVRLVLTYAPGGSTDAVMRPLVPEMAQSLGQPVVIDNRGGAGGVLGTELVARAVPDGYTILLGTSAGMTINPLLQKNLPYDPVRDFAPISLVVINPQMLVAAPSLPANTIAELVALARAKPGSLNYASPGIGSPNHMGMELLKSMARIDLVHVPYRGGGPASTDLIGGQVALMFNSVPSMIGYLKAGRLKAIAIGGAKRSPAMPDLPTVAESGLPGFEYATWYGLFAPAGTPAPVIAKLNATIGTALRNPERTQQLLAQGAEPSPSTPAQLREFMAAERERWMRVVKVIGPGQL